MIISEFLRVLYVMGMVFGIGFCALCVLMCIFIGVMVIRACLSYDDDGMWPEEEKENKEGDEGQISCDDELNWSDVEEKENDTEESVWLVREEDGTWVKKEGKKVYMKVGEEGDSEEQVR